MESIEAKPYQTIVDLCMAATGGLSYLPEFCQINECSPEDEAEVGKLYYYNYIENENVANAFKSEQPSSVTPSGSSDAPLPIDRLYSAGNGIKIENNVISTKIDNGTIKFNAEGEIYCDVSAFEQTIIEKALNGVLTDILPTAIEQTLQRVAQELLPTTLQSAKDYANEQDAVMLQEAKDYADAQDEIALQSAKDYADTKQTQLHFINCNYLATPTYGRIWAALQNVKQGQFWFFGKYRDTNRIVSLTHYGSPAQGVPDYWRIEYLSGTSRNYVDCFPEGFDTQSTTAVQSNFNMFVIWWD